jgi:hypothetical protein
MGILVILQKVVNACVAWGSYMDIGVALVRMFQHWCFTNFQFNGCRLNDLQLIVSLYTEDHWWRFILNVGLFTCSVNAFVVLSNIRVVFCHQNTFLPWFVWPSTLSRKIFFRYLRFDGTTVFIFKIKKHLALIAYCGCAIKKPLKQGFPSNYHPAYCMATDVLLYKFSEAGIDDSYIKQVPLNISV